jgi:Putative prokaryotic signal transducing protein
LSAPELSCPSCGRAHPKGSAFCAGCGMPLVGAGEPLETPLSDAHGRARKINPGYTEGELVRVAGGRNQAEAELIQNLLLEEGVPSVLRRTAGFDVPDYLAAGPRDVLVPEAGVDAARDVLLEAELAPTAASDSARPNPVIVFGTVALGGALAALVAWLLLQGV